MPGKVLISPSELADLIQSEPAVLIDTRDAAHIAEAHKGAHASNTFVALEEAGVKDVKIYFGLWNEWSRDSSLPIEEGLPDGARTAA